MGEAAIVFIKRLQNNEKLKFSVEKIFILALSNVSNGKKLPIIHRLIG